MDKDLAIIWDKMQSLARTAGQMAMDARANGTIETWDKSPNNPVSNADIAIDEFLQKELMAFKPSYGWLSEELADDLARLDKTRVWIVDPIDGTKGYLRGGDDFCVSIALVENGAPILGVLMAAAEGILYKAAKGLGAFANDKPIKCNSAIDLRGRTMVGDINYFKSKKVWPAPWPRMTYITANSIALRFAWVASGKADLVVTASPKCDWDLAAATLILEEAGGWAGDDHNIPFCFNQKHTLHFPVIGCTPDLTHQIRAITSPAITLKKLNRLKNKEN
jgi:myo-inositol-1(or 4)-monophosphatase